MIMISGTCSQPSRLTLLFRYLRQLSASTAFALALLLPATALALDIPILYLELKQQRPALLSNVIPEPEDSGLKGALLGVADNNTTGRFLKHHYQLQNIVSDDPQAVINAAKEWTQQNSGLVIANLPKSLLLKTHKAVQPHGALIINAGDSDNQLRTRQCQTGLLHTAPSRAMLTDALAQFLIQRRWRQWMIVSGQRPEDLAFTQSLQRSAQRFGGKVKDVRQWQFDTDLRRTAQQEIPPFTRGPDYDVLLVADEKGDVGEFIPYNTWLPRPVAGTQGLTPVGWHRVIEQWGAAQLQNRFRELSQRDMTATDYAAWLAARTLAEAVTRTGSVDPSVLYSFMLSPEFEVAAFRGRKLTFRTWNGQIRQPIALVHPRALISQSPQEGFLHPVTDLDTLGFDRPETSCNFKTTLGVTP